MKTKEDILKVNETQATFYDQKNRNWITAQWAHLRTRYLGRIRRDLGIQNQIYATHKEWLGDLSNRKVLDLGCFEGNALSVYLAQNAAQYVGIDLSAKGIAILSKKIQDIPTATAVAVDFLSEDFDQRDFDVVYAYGVIHHFENMRVLIDRLKEVMRENAILITYDPLKTSLPVMMVRGLYRPFQSDAAWEWPLSKKVVRLLSSEFYVKQRRAVLGKSKYAMFLSLLPISYERKLRLGQKWHKQDWDKSLDNDSNFYQGMHATLLLEKKLN